MPVTLQQIADRAGVSRGTVDRALNNRGRIRPEVSARIKQIAREMGYQPSLAGRALVMSKKQFKIGVIIHSAETPFMRELKEGAMEAKTEVEGLGTSVDIHTLEGVDVNEITKLLTEMMESHYNGIALTGVTDWTLGQLVNRCVDEYGIPVVTFNGDMEDTHRLCYVGQNTRRSGETAAGLLGELLTEGKVAVIAENRNNSGVNSRLEGFREVMARECPDVEVMETRYAYGDEWVSEKLTEVFLCDEPDLKAIYVAGSGVVGVCRALEAKGAARDICLIANDYIQENMELVRKGDINFLVAQKAHFQGYEPIKILFNKLINNQDPEENMDFEDILIKTRYNL